MIGALDTEADLQRFLQRELARPGVIPPGQLSGILITERTIEGTKVVPNTLTGDLLVEGTITAREIEAGAITAEKIEAGSITADKLNVTELSAITANLGTVTAGTIEGLLVKGNTIEGGTISGTTITGTTLTGGTVRTAASGARVEMTSLGIKGINAAAVTKFNFDTTTGILEATAVIDAEAGSTIPTEYLAGQITETQIEEGAINTPQLRANAVTAAKISVSNLAAIKADLGEVTAGTINGLLVKATTIEGGTISGTTIEALEAFSLEESAVEASPTNPHLVKWVKSGKTRSEVFGYGDETRAQLNLWANRLAGQEEGRVALRAYDKAASQNTKLSVAAKSTSSANYKVTIEAREAGPLILFDGEGRSDLLQLTSTAKRKVNFGEVKLTFEAASKKSNEPTVEHGLGVKPAFAVLQVESTGGSETLIVTRVVERTTTKIKFYAASSVAFGAKTEVTCLWAAIG